MVLGPWAHRGSDSVTAGQRHDLEVSGSFVVLLLWPVEAEMGEGDNELMTFLAHNIEAGHSLVATTAHDMMKKRRRLVECGGNGEETT